jgi:hypothetical protein
MRGGSIVGGLKLRFPQKTFIVGVFAQIVRLSSHSRLITLDTVSLNNYPINRDVHSTLDFDDISDTNEVSMNFFYNSVS